MIAWAEWQEEYGPNCPGCQDMYQNRHPPGKPPCETCRVKLLQSNFEAANIFNLARNQVLVAGMGQVIGINHLAVWEAIDRYKVEKPVECFEKVLEVFSHMQKGES